MALLFDEPFTSLTNWTTVNTALAVDSGAVWSSTTGNAGAYQDPIGMVSDGLQIDVEFVLTDASAATYIHWHWQSNFRNGNPVGLYSALNQSGYSLRVLSGGLLLEKDAAGTLTNLGSYSGTINDTDEIRIENVGGQIKVLHRPSGGVWVERINAANSDYTSGRIGVEISGNSAAKVGRIVANSLAWINVDSASGNTNSPSLALSSLAAGDIIIFARDEAIGTAGNFQDNPPTDTASNTYVLGASATTVNGQFMTWWLALHNGASSSITISAANGSSFYAWLAAAYRTIRTGGIKLHSFTCKALTSTGTGADAAVGRDIKTVAADSLLVGLACEDGGGLTLTAGTGFTARETVNLNGTSDPFVIEDRVVASPSTVQPKFSPNASMSGLLMGMVFGAVDDLPPVNVATPSPSADADDGWGYRSNATWPVTSGAFSDEFDVTTGYVSMAFDGATYDAGDVFLRFDTSAIPATAIILWAELQLFMGVSGSQNFFWGGDYYDFGGSPSVAADWTGSLTDSASIFTMSSSLYIENAKSHLFGIDDLSGIKRSGEANAQGNSGITGIRISPLTNFTPNANNFVNIAMREHATNPAAVLRVAYYNPFDWPTGAYADEVAADEPLAYWRLSDLTDSGPNELDLTENGTISDASGLIGTEPSEGAQSFPGVATNWLSRVTSAFVGPPVPWTMEAWVMSDVIDTSERMILHKGSFSLIKTTNNRIRAEYLAGGFGQGFSLRTIAAGVPYHVVSSWDGSNIRIYINGMLESTTGHAGAQATNATDLGIGGHTAGGWGWWDGIIDEVAIYGVALSPARVQAHYEAALADETFTLGIAAMPPFFKGG